MQQEGSLPLWEQHHGLLDVVGVQFGSLFTPKFFRDGIESPPFDAHLDGVTLSSPGDLDSGPHRVTAETLVGPLSAGVHVATEIRADRPTILFHHGIGEIEARTRFRRLLQPGTAEIDANLLAIRAPFHASYSEFSRGVASLTNLLAMQAVSVNLLETIQRQTRAALGGPILISGISLGGFIANLHHIHFGTADRYVPILAGLAEDDVFLRSPYRQSTAEDALSNPAYLEDRLNFEAAFAETDPAGVHPLLGRYDRIVRYETQYSSYNGRPVSTVDCGHVTGSIESQRIRDHIKRFVQREQQGV